MSRVDPQTETVKTFATGALPIDLAAGAGALWVLQGEKSGARRASYDTVSTPAAVARIDPLSGTRRGISPLPVPATATLRVPLGTWSPQTAESWSVGRPGWVHRLDTARGRVLTQRSLDAFGIAAGDGPGSATAKTVSCASIAIRDARWLASRCRRARQRDCCRRGLGVADRPRGRDGVALDSRRLEAHDAVAPVSIAWP